ncbi:MAG: FAD-binding oxidoreductase [Rhodocyclaceae bacterium]
MPELIAGLRRIVGDAYVVDAPNDLAPYLSDWRGRYTGQASCAVRPASTEELAAVVHLCAENNIAIVPQGGNTGLVGGSVPCQGGEVIVSTGRLNRVREVDPANNTITVEAGCTLAAVQEAAQDADRLFPLSLAAEGTCQIGGNLSTNAGGVHVLRYGNTRELTLGLEVVLPDGQIWNGLRGLRKDNTGYDLKHLFIGAEGTLGIITAAVLKLFPLPRSRSVGWVALRDADAAIELLALMRGTAGDRLSAFEIVGRSALELVLKHLPGTNDPLADAHDWYALVELSDPAPGEVTAPLLEEGLSEAMEAGLVLDAVLAASEAQAAALWALRENISEAQRVEGISIKHDVSVPVSRIPDFLREAGAALRDEFPDVRIVAFGHVGDGNLHYNMSKPDAADNSTFIAQTPRVNRIVHDVVAAKNGSISAEHGLGQLKREEVRRYKQPLELELMKAIKHSLDPKGIMNPGKLL